MLLSASVNSICTKNDKLSETCLLEGHQGSRELAKLMITLHSKAWTAMLPHVLQVLSPSHHGIPLVHEVILTLDEECFKQVKSRMQYE